MAAFSASASVLSSSARGTGRGGAMKVAAGAGLAAGGGGGWDGSVDTSGLEVVYGWACDDEDDDVLRFAVYRASSAKVERGVMGEMGGRVGDSVRGASSEAARSVLFV